LADTGFKDATAIDGKYSDFTDAINAYASDDAYATYNETADQSHNQSYETFGFSIPEGATITGIEATAEWKGTTDGSPPFYSLRLYYWSASDNLWSTGKEITWRTSEAVDTEGGSTDLWGRTPIDTDFSDANFSFRIRSAGNADNDDITFFVDHIQVKVYYSTTVDYNMPVTVGVFTLTGIANILTRGYKIAVTVGEFILTGISVNLLRSIRNMAVSVGEFVLIGITTGLKKGWKMAVAVGNFILTGISAILSRTGWTIQSKNTTDYTNESKNTTNWSEQSKHTTNYTNPSKNTTNWDNQDKK